jgi:hypothetical protein
LWKVAVSTVGTVTTAFVAGIVMVVKFTDGAWIPVVLIPLLVLMFLGIKRHYVHVRGFLTAQPGETAPFRTHFVIILVGSVNKGVLKAIKYAESLRPDRLIAVSVVDNDEAGAELRREWARFRFNVELVTEPNKYRDLTGEVLRLLDRLDADDADDLITVVIPEFVTSIQSQWLHNQTALALKARLLYRPNTVVTSVPIVIPYGDETAAD